MTAAGTLEAFNAEQFRGDLAVWLGRGIQPSDITLTISAASVLITVDVVVTAKSTAEATATLLRQTEGAALASALGLIVQRVTPPTITVRLLDSSPSPPPPVPLPFTSPLPHSHAPQTAPATPVVPTSSATTAMTSAKGDSPSLLLFVVIAGSASAVLLMGLLLCWYRRRRTQKRVQLSSNALRTFFQRQASKDSVNGRSSPGKRSIMVISKLRVRRSPGSQTSCRAKTGNAVGRAPVVVHRHFGFGESTTDTHVMDVVVEVDAELKRGNDIENVIDDVKQGSMEHVLRT